MQKSECTESGNWWIGTKNVWTINIYMKGLPWKEEQGEIHLAMNVQNKRIFCKYL